jgi:hypothetical protein
LDEYVSQSRVIPARAIRAAIKPLPGRLAQDAIVKEYGFGIVGFVGNKDWVGLLTT